MGHSGAPLAAWCPGGRAEAWERLGGPWDLIVVGGGITGAGIFSLALRSGLRVLLLEQGDFASGTSSRSSKLVHGGLRYLKQMQVRLTRESVREREYLLKNARGLVEPLPFLYPVYKEKRAESWLVGLGLSFYTHLAPEVEPHDVLDPMDLELMAPGLEEAGLLKAFRYLDACTDDARLVLRVLQDALRAAGGRGLALNYARVTDLLRRGGRVAGVGVQDRETGATAEISASLVINATGVWGDALRGRVGAPPRLRPLRGSHLFFPRRRLPLFQAVVKNHPADGRPIFIFPWEGLTLVGTTDVDHDRPLDEEPRIAGGEFSYMLEAAQRLFPNFGLRAEDVQAVQAGVRPVVHSGKKNPSEESREHAIWEEEGLLTVTGGKLTTFHHVAAETLQKTHDLHPTLPPPDGAAAVLDPVDPDRELPPLEEERARRLWGRYGAAAPQILRRWPDALAPIPGTPYLWGELLWAAGHEAVVRLDDLLLRRLRLGILLPDGGQDLEAPLHAQLPPILGWDEARWKGAWADYLALRMATQANPEGRP